MEAGWSRQGAQGGIYNLNEKVKILCDPGTLCSQETPSCRPAQVQPGLACFAQRAPEAPRCQWKQENKNESLGLGGFALFLSSLPKCTPGDNILDTFKIK